MQMLLQDGRNARGWFSKLDARLDPAIREAGSNDSRSGAENGGGGGAGPRGKRGPARAAFEYLGLVVVMPPGIEVSCYCSFLLAATKKRQGRLARTSGMEVCTDSPWRSIRRGLGGREPPTRMQR